MLLGRRKRAKIDATASQRKNAVAVSVGDKFA